MSAAAIKDNIARVGEVLGFTKLAGAAGAVNVNAIVNMLDGATISMMLDDVEAMGVVAPGLKLVVAGDCTVIENDTFTRDGRTYTVFKMFPYYIGSVVQSRLVVAS